MALAPAPADAGEKQPASSSDSPLHPNLLQPVQYVKTKPTNTTVLWFTPSTCATATAGCTFQIPATGFGNMTRNSLVGPGFADTDISVEKNTVIAEAVKFQLRVDAFDIFNYASFGNPVTSANSTTLGIISSTRFPVRRPRLIAATPDRR
jgi:hypothetical protein